MCLCVGVERGNDTELCECQQQGMYQGVDEESDDEYEKDVRIR